MKSMPCSARFSFLALIAQQQRRDWLRHIRFTFFRAIPLPILCCAGSVLLGQAPANFGTVNVGTTSAVVPVTLTFATSGTLASTLVLTQGAGGLDYADAGSDTCAANMAYSAGQTCTVNVTFAPRFAGIRHGAVVLQDGSGNTMATGLLQGVGAGPQVLFQPGIQSALGSGINKPASVAVDGNGDIFVTNVGSTVLYEMVAVNGTVPASPTIRTIGSGFGSQIFVTLDAGGNLYIADTLNNAVKEVLAVNGSIPASPTIVTLGSGFSYPGNIAVDSSGNVYVTGLVDNTVKEMLAVNGAIPSSPRIEEWGSGFQEPIGIAVDSSGNIYVADSGHNAIKEIEVPNGGAVVTLGSGFYTPYSIALDSNNDLYVADYGNNAVKEMVAVNGSIPASPVINTLGSGFLNPAGVALDGSGNVYVADYGNGRVEKLDYADAPSLTFASTAVGAISTDSPRTITVLNAGNAALTFPIPSTGNNPSIAANFTLNSSGASACPLLTSESAQPATLAAGASCQLPISFAPTETGALNGSLVLTDNNLNAAAPNYIAQTIALSGTATGSFTLSSSPSSLTMTQGSIGTATITISDQNGFDGSVTLHASGLPSGVSASFSPNPATGTSVVTLTASSLSSLASSQPVTITGTSGTLTATTTILLTVNPANFTLSSSTSSMNINQGNSGTATITVNDQNGFAGSVNLSATNLPSGVSATFSPNPTSGTSLLTLTASSTAAPGTYYVSIAGTAGTETAYAPNIVLTVVHPNFTVSATNSSVTVIPGSSYQDGIQVTYGNGLEGNISLAASGLPTGLTASFSPNPVTATGTSILTLSANASTTPGTYNITVTGTYGSVNVSTNITVTVPPPTFLVSSSVSSSGVVQGTSLESTITVLPAPGFSGAVTLSASNLPSGVTASFSVNPTSSTSILTLNFSSSAAVGNATITITGTSGTQTASTTIFVSIAAAGFLSSNAAFGAVNTGTTSVFQSLPYTFGASVTLGSAAVITEGATGLDFANAGSGTCTANTAYAAGQSCTVDVTFTPLFAGNRNGAVELIDTNGNVIATAHLQGTGVGPQVGFAPARQVILGSGYTNPVSTAVDGNGDVYVADETNGEIKEILAVNGKIPPSPVINVLGSGFSYPRGVALDGAGNIYVADYGNNAIKEIEAVNGSIPPSPAIVTLASAVSNPWGIAVDGNGDVFFTQPYSNAVNEIVAVEGSIPASPAIQTIGSGFNFPIGVAVDSSGNVYVSDSYNSAVKEILAVNGSIPASPTIETLSNSFTYPAGLAVDGVGNVYVSDYGANAVKEMLAVNGSVPVSPNVVTLASGLNAPYGVAVDGAFNVYISDTQNNRILELDDADPPSLTFANTAFGSTSSDSPQTVTIENNGNAALAFPIPASGNNPSIGADFVLNGNAPSACPILSSGSSEAGTLAAGASCVLSMSFSPTTAGALDESLALTDNNLNAPSPDYVTQSIALSGTGTAATPTIDWSAPGAITYGTALGAAQLNATASVPGTFSYSPAAGTVLGAGTQTLTVTFTPTDSTDYTTAAATVTLTVNQAAPAITWGTPTAIPYGTALGSAQLDASSTVGGTFSYSPGAGTVLTAGTHTLTATFTPTDTTDYTTAAATVTLTVSKALPVVTWPAPGAIVYGTALSAAQLDATANVPGSFGYSPGAGAVLGAGTQTLSVTFTPNDSTDYNPATAAVALTVNKATPTITWPAPAPIVAGTALGSAQLDATASVGGAFAYSPAAGTVLPAGSQTLTTVFTPSDSADYNTAAASVVLQVNPPPSFTLSASSGSLAVVQGKSATDTITVVGQNGFHSSVTLSASGAPSGVTAQFGTNPTSGSSVLTFTASRSTKVGTYSITLKGISGSLSASTMISLTVNK